MTTEKQLLKISGKYTLVAIAATLFFWFVIFGMGVCHAQTQTGYRVPAGYDCGNGARVTSRMNFQVGTGSTFVMRYGTTTITGSGSTGYMSGTDSAYPRWVWTPATGRMNFLDIILQQNGVDIAAYGNSAALAAALSDETGTNTVVFSSGSTQTNATFTGNTTISSPFTLGAVSVLPTGTELNYVDGVTSAIQTQINAKENTLSNSAGLAAAISDETGTNTVVYSSGSTQTNATFTGNSNFPGSGIWNSSGNVGIGQAVPSARLEVQDPSGAPTSPLLRVRDGNGIKLEVASSGNVGIGTTTPIHKLTSMGVLAVLNNGNGGKEIARFFNQDPDSNDSSYIFLGEADATNKCIAFGYNDANNYGYFAIYGDTAGDGLNLCSGNKIGIGTTTPNNILTLPIASATDPIADSWINHCLADYKEIGTETAEMVQDSANDIVKNTPVSIFTKKAIIADEEAEREPKQKYQDKIKESAKADLELYTAETGVAVNNNSYIDELVNSMWETKADRLAIVEANKQILISEKKALPKFQRKNYGIVAEDAPPEAQVLREDGSLQGVDTSVLVGILWANAQKQEVRISALESEIDNLYIIIEVLAGLLGIGGSASWLVQRRKRNA